MTRFNKLYLDANIFIALIEWNNTVSQMLVNLICEQPADKPPVFCTSQLTLAETLVHPAKAQDEQMLSRYEATVLDSHWLDVVPVDRDILYYSAIIRSKFKGLKLPDAIHLSSAFAMGCSHFLTNDRDFQGLYDFAHRREWFTASPAPVSILRPDEPTLTGLIESLTA